MDADLKPMRFVKGGHVFTGWDWEMSCYWGYGPAEDQVLKSAQMQVQTVPYLNMN